MIYQIILHSNLHFYFSTSFQLSLAELYVKLIRCNYDLSRRFKLEERLWRNCAYSVLQGIRSYVNKDPERRRAVGSLAGGIITKYRALYDEIINALKGFWDENLPHSGTEVPYWHYSVLRAADIGRYSIIVLSNEEGHFMNGSWPSVLRLYRSASLLAPHSG